MVDLGNGFEAEVVASFEGSDYGPGKDFGLELTEPVTGRQLDNFLLSPEDGCFWQVLGQYEVLFGKIDPGYFDFKYGTKATLPKTDWFSAMNDRRILNVLWHADPHDLALYSSSDRIPTAFAPREHVVQAYLNQLEGFKAKYPHLLEYIVAFQVSLAIAYKTQSLYAENNGVDSVKRLISQFVMKISLDSRVDDQDIFALQKSLDEGVDTNQIARPWKEGDFVVFSRRTFHQRICTTVDDVDQQDSPIYFHKVGCDKSSAYVAEYA